MSDATFIHYFFCKCGRRCREETGAEFICFVCNNYVTVKLGGPVFDPNDRRIAVAAAWLRNFA